MLSYPLEFSPLNSMQVFTLTIKQFFLLIRGTTYTEQKFLTASAKNSSSSVQTTKTCQNKFFFHANVIIFNL